LHRNFKLNKWASIFVNVSTHCKPRALHRSIPPRNIETSVTPAFRSCCAAIDDRRSVLQTTTTERFSRTRSGKRVSSSLSGMFVAPLICPSGPVNSSGPRTSRRTGGVSRSRRVARTSDSIHDGAVGVRRNQRDSSFIAPPLHACIRPTSGRSLATLARGSAQDSSDMPRNHISTEFETSPERQGRPGLRARWPAARKTGMFQPSTTDR
jgi:hypothetical protein